MCARSCSCIYPRCVPEDIKIISTVLLREGMNRRFCTSAPAFYSTTVNNLLCSVSSKNHSYVNTGQRQKREVVYLEMVWDLRACMSCC